MTISQTLHRGTVSQVECGICRLRVVFAGLVSRAVDGKDLPDELHVHVDVLRGLLPPSSHLARLRAARDAPTSLPPGLGCVHVHHRPL